MTLTPSCGLTILPFLTSWLTMLTTSFEGIANPIPSTEVPSLDCESFIELIPITCPAELTSAPPELPGLIAASVWITVCWLAEDVVMLRAGAEMIPCVTVEAYSLPSGDPTAITVCPA